jgi:hypothetical protein
VVTRTERKSLTRGGFEWARQDLNLQPTDYESAALTRLSYGPSSQNTWPPNAYPKTPQQRTTTFAGLVAQVLETEPRRPLDSDRL